MSGHTPGPWEAYVRVARDGGSYTIAVHEQGYPEKRTPVVAWPGFDDSRRPIAEHAANARLIAAAPELLEALEAILGPLATIPMGESGAPDERVPVKPNLRVSEAAILRARAAIAKARGGES